MSPDGITVLYAAIGAALVPHAVDAGGLTLSPRPGVTLPAAVQYAWFHPRLPLIYAAYSNRATPGGNDRHGVAALRIDAATGALSPFGPPVAMSNRPIHVTADDEGRWLLLTCNQPAELNLHPLGSDGAIGAVVPQQGPLRLGAYPHQARFLPGGGRVVVPARGNDPGPTTAGEPGEIGLYDLKDGQLRRAGAITEGNGLGFGPRHVDLRAGLPWLYAALERGNRLLTYRAGAGGLVSAFSAETLPGGSTRGAPEQYAGAVQLHPCGSHVYVANRSDGTVPFGGTAVHGAGENSIAVFAIDRATGEPRLSQRADTRGIHCRSFAIDPDGLMLVAGSVAPMAVRRGEAVEVLAAGLSVFAIGEDGSLSFARKYDIPAERGPVFWCGMRRLG